MKAKILGIARKLFGQYGFQGTTTRMIAKEAGIDISTLHYHWGDKGDLFEAVIHDLNFETRNKLIEIEKKIKGKPLTTRIEIALDDMLDFLFENPEISNHTIFRYFTQTTSDLDLDIGLGSVPEYISDIAYSMGLSKDRKTVSSDAQMKVIFMMNALHNFVSGETFFRSMLKIDRDEYRKLAKQTLNFYNIAPYK
ncbi:MAG: TetR/AcrR family transcriptional regulator [Proteobacteria bacterium]|nr:TetR/AcrR family transcriptional regulator [Pseudomonadota bacterium]